MATTGDLDITDHGLLTHPQTSRTYAGRLDLIATRLRRLSDQRTFQIIGYLPMPGDADAVPQSLRLDPAPGLMALLHEHDIDEVVIAVDERRGILPGDHQHAVHHAAGHPHRQSRRKAPKAVDPTTTNQA